MGIKGARISSSTWVILKRNHEGGSKNGAKEMEGSKTHKQESNWTKEGPPDKKGIMSWPTGR